MKKIMIALCGVAVITACNNSTENQSEKTTDTHTTHSMTTPMSSVDSVKALKAQFAQLNYASKIDTICGMPVKAGVVDTLVLDGKIYGFCATGCKEEFAKTLIAQGKR